MRFLRLLLLISCFLGFLLVYMAWSIVPPWLLGALLSGLAGFVAATALAYRGKAVGYWLGFILALVVLAVSIPAPAHIQFLLHGMFLQSTVFVAGNMLQILYIALFVKHILLKRRPSRDL
ncbi:MAG: hypothetical protein QXG69_05320 [Candidatus Caldarchaeum sp.]